MKIVTTALTILVLAGGSAAFACGNAKMNQTTAQQNESPVLPPSTTQS